MDSHVGTRQYDDRTDAELVALYAATRDELAFRVLYRRHAPRLLRLLMRITGGGRADVEDIVQEAWIRCAERVSQLRQAQNFYGWLRGIAIHIELDARRRAGRRSRIIPLDTRDVNDVLGEGARVEMADGLTGTADERVMDLEKCIQSLPDGYRAVLVLHDVEGFTHEEIASMLGIASGTSKSQLSAARRTIRRMMNELVEKEGEDVNAGT
jgi:RNA polymerase sigma-70 factor (ECF subfamily)